MPVILTSIMQFWLITASSAVAGPCADGGWGAVADPATAVHVQVGGQDAQDGSQSQPFATVGRALQAVTGGGEIALGPGDFTGGISIDIPIGVRISGCGADETTLSATGGKNVEVNGNRAILSGLTVSGGQYGVTVDGADVVLDNVRVEAATRVGVHAQGRTAAVRLLHSEIVDITCEDGDGCGWGLSSRDATVQLIDSEISHTTEVGLVTFHSDVLLDRSRIAHTQRNASGDMGRGAHLQHGIQRLVDTTIEDNHDIGVFSLAPKDLFVSGIAIDVTGIGLHNRGYGMAVDGRGVSTYITVEDSEFTNSATAPVVLQSLGGWVADNTLASNGLANKFHLQGNVSIDGTDSGDVVFTRRLNVRPPVLVPPRL